MRSSSNYSPNRNPNDGGGEFLALAAAVVFAIFVGIPALGIVLSVVGGLADASVWIAGASGLAVQLIWGFFLGCAIGLIRFRLKVRNRTVERLLESLGTPEAVSAARLGAVSLLFHIAISLSIAAFIAFLGVHSPAVYVSDHHSILVSGGALFHAIGGGSGGGDGPGLLAILFATLILLVAIGALLGILVSLGFGAIAWNGLSGAAFAAGETTGLATVLVLTQLYNNPDQGLLLNRETLAGRGWVKKVIATGAATGAITGTVYYVLWVLLGTIVIGLRP